MWVNEHGVTCRSDMGPWTCPSELSRSRLTFPPLRPVWVLDPGCSSPLQFWDQVWFGSSRPYCRDKKSHRRHCCGPSSQVALLKLFVVPETLRAYLLIKSIQLGHDESFLIEGAHFLLETSLIRVYPSARTNNFLSSMGQPCEPWVSQTHLEGKGWK